MSKYNPKRKPTLVVWDAAHGEHSALLDEAVRLGGRVVPAASSSTAGNGNGSQPSRAETAGGDDCLLLVKRLLDGERLSEAIALEAIGERRQAREVQEDLFVRLLAAWCDCAGAVAVGDVINGLAYLLRVSPATTKRYLRAHASPFGEFVLDGDFVRLRGGGR